MSLLSGLEMRVAKVHARCMDQEAAHGESRRLARDRGWAGQAVVILPAERYVGPPGPVSLAAVGFHRSVTVTLARPLGQRVVVDLDATPVTVLPADPEPAG